MTSACAGTAFIADTIMANATTWRPGDMQNSLFQRGGDMLGMLLMPLEDLKPGLQQALELSVARRRDQQGFQRAVDGLVVGDFVGDIGPVERRAGKFRKLDAL